jgi:hypothetical protein
MGSNFHCSICGNKISNNHRCKESVLRGIDDAHKRAWEDAPENPPPFYTRLRDGMNTMFMSEDNDD